MIFEIILGVTVSSICFLYFLQEKGIAKSAKPEQYTIAFFHPYCNAGGGGERVLWTAIQALETYYPKASFVIYSGDDQSKQSILDAVNDKLSIKLDGNRINFVNLNLRFLVNGSLYSHLTLLGQAIGSMILVLEAIFKNNKFDIFIDTMGYAFTYPIVKIFNSNAKIVAYTHYPTISSDMVNRVHDRQSSYANSQTISQSASLSKLKELYYRLLIKAYGICLNFTNTNMVNSSWTSGHIKNITGDNKNVKIVYPPCNTKSMEEFELKNRKKIILCVAQFRPEKAHSVQLDAFSQLISKTNHKDTQLVLVGSARNDDDHKRVVALESQARELKIEDSVKFVVNASYEEVLHWLSISSIGINTMIDEHFGINVVEYMAAGLIPLAHASAGPLLDIIIKYDNQITGYHANTITDFADRMKDIFDLNEADDYNLRLRARSSVVERLSENTFKDNFIKYIT